MDTKLLIILSLVFILGIGYANYLPTSVQVGERQYVQSNLPTTIEAITLLLLSAVLVSYWLINRKKESSLNLILKTLGSVLVPAVLTGIFLLVLYRMQFSTTKGGTLGVERIRILGQTLSTDGAAIVFIFIVLMFSIIYLNLRNYLSATSENRAISFWKLSIAGIALSLVSGVIVGWVVAYGKHGETGLIGIIVPIAYFIGGLITSLITSAVVRLQSKKQLPYE